MLDEQQWQTQLDADLTRYYSEDPRFMVCIVSQSSNKVVAMETELRERYPHLNIKRLIGSDSGETKRQALEDINETLEDVNFFLYSPVIKSGVDIHGQGQEGPLSAQLQEQLTASAPPDDQPLSMRRGAPTRLRERRGGSASKATAVCGSTPS
jgi:hypothetical protein